MLQCSLNSNSEFQMSNVRISAIGDAGIEVEVLLGVTSRGKHLVNSGDSVDLTVGGNQRLVTKESDKAASTAKAEIPVGADVTDEPAAETEETGVLAKLGSALFSDAEANAELPVQGDLFDGEGFDKSDR